MQALLQTSRGGELNITQLKQAMACTEAIYRAQQGSYMLYRSVHGFAFRCIFSPLQYNRLSRQVDIWLPLFQLMAVIAQRVPSADMVSSCHTLMRMPALSTAAACAASWHVTVCAYMHCAAHAQGRHDVQLSQTATACTNHSSLLCCIMTCHNVHLGA